MSSKNEKQEFMKSVTILVDTREQVNEHILSAFRSYGVMFEERKLDYGDYSFLVGDKDFSKSCIIERKANVDELYNNVTTDRERIEKELDTISRNARQCTLLVENCAGWTSLKMFSLTQEQMEQQHRKVQNIGATVYAALQAWKCGNRYNFSVEFVHNPDATANKMLECFYYFYHNYRRQTAPRKDA